jgi:hypothetical protein
MFRAILDFLMVARECYTQESSCVVLAAPAVCAVDLFVDTVVICCAALGRAYHSHSGMCSKMNGSRYRCMGTWKEEMDGDAVV